MASIPRSTTSGYFSLDLDGVKCGFLKTFSGGDVVADVAVAPAAGGGFPRKHLGPPRTEPLHLGVGFGMTHDLFDWIAASWTQNYARKDGSVVTSDAQLAARSELRFTDALVTETTIPALDGAARDPAYLTVVLEPESTRTVKAKGKVAAAKAQKQFLPSNFRLEIAGLDCTKVSKVGSFTVRAEPGHIEFPNLAITLPELIAESWIDWHEDFVLRGRNDQSKEKTGSLSLLTANRQAELARIDLFGLGIFALRRQAGGDAIASRVAGLYCERMELTVPKG